MLIEINNGAAKVVKEFATQDVLELACAAQRWNKGYLKTAEAVFEDSGEIRFWKQPNKINILYSLKSYSVPDGIDPRQMPVQLQVEEEDRAEAAEIRKFFKRLVFSAVKGTNEFETEINAILSSDNVAANQIGYVACLPSVFKRDYSKNQIEKRARSLDKGYVGDIGQQLLDKDCEVLESNRSKNFDAFNITAIIDNKMVSWFSKTDLKLGACVLVKAKVKDHTTHWKLKDTDVTRLNYVKAAQ